MTIKSTTPDLSAIEAALNRSAANARELAHKERVPYVTSNTNHYFELLPTNTPEALIKVIGVGGAGGNFIEHMLGKNLVGADFIAINTDTHALKKSSAKINLLIGHQLTKGLGATTKREIGREAAFQDRDAIAELIDGADMLFITAGMGGGTGTGAAPVIAEIAKELGILTVAVVTKPFAFEGKRTKIAIEGLKELSKYVDSLIVIPNEKLMEALGDDVPFIEAFSAANNVIYLAVSGIVEIINRPGLIGVDFADVRTLMSEMGIAVMGSATATGQDRARIATELALVSPWLEDFNIAKARGILVSITASTSFKMKEFYDVMNTLKSTTTEDTVVLVGNVLDDNMEESFLVTIVATGIEDSVTAKSDFGADGNVVPSVFSNTKTKLKHVA